MSDKAPGLYNDPALLRLMIYAPVFVAALNLSIQIRPDTKYEPTETFYLNLSALVNATIAKLRVWERSSMTIRTRRRAISRIPDNADDSVGHDD